MRNKTAILILAAGKSSRMGEPKQLLSWNKNSLVGNAIEQAEKLNDVSVFVILGANYELIQPKIEACDIQIILNENWENGMGSSVSCGMKEIVKKKHFHNVLIMLADQPFVTTEYLEDMLRIQDLESNKIVASRYSNNFGVPAVFGKNYFLELMSLCTEEGAKNMIKKYANLIESPTLKFFSDDIDTMENYKDLIHRAKK